MTSPPFKRNAIREALISHYSNVLPSDHLNSTVKGDNYSSKYSQGISFGNQYPIQLTQNFMPYTNKVYPQYHLRPDQKCYQSSYYIPQNAYPGLYLSKIPSVKPSAGFNTYLYPYNECILPQSQNSSSNLKYDSLSKKSSTDLSRYITLSTNNDSRTGSEMSSSKAKVDILSSRNSLDKIETSSNDKSKDKKSSKGLSSFCPINDISIGSILEEEKAIPDVHNDYGFIDDSINCLASVIHNSPEKNISIEKITELFSDPAELLKILDKKTLKKIPLIFEELLNKKENVHCEAIGFIVRQITDNFNMIAQKRYGLMLLSRLFRLFQNTKKYLLYIWNNALRKNLVSLCTNDSSNRCVQTFIQCIQDYDFQLQIVDSFTPLMDVLCYDRYGNHVIQRLLSSVPTVLQNKLISYILDNFASLSRDPNGICVIKKYIIILGSESKEKKEVFIKFVNSFIPDLLVDYYGVHVVSGLFEFIGIIYCREVIDFLLKNIMVYALNERVVSLYHRSIYYEKDEVSSIYITYNHFIYALFT
jgi:hypothetical protein